MNNKNVLLLKTLLRSTSSLNVLKTSKDRKKKGKIIGTFIAYIMFQNTSFDILKRQKAQKMSLFGKKMFYITIMFVNFTFPC